MHSTNYKNTLIKISEDCPVKMSKIPPEKKIKTLVRMHYDMISENPYRYTSDEVLFEVFALKNNLSEQEKNNAKQLFFSKGQPCFRSSALPKRYGFGIHHDNDEKISIFGVESETYENMVKDESVTKVYAMRSKRS